MRHDIIKTDNYLIIVDDSDIKNDDWTYHPIKGLYKAVVNGAYTNQKKVIAHLPLTISPVLEGVDLLLPLDDDCDSLQGYVESLSQPKYPVAFEQGDEVINETYTSVTRKGDGYTIWIGKYIY